MLIAYDVNQIRRYVLKKEAEDPSPTVFLLGVLDSALAAHVLDESTTFSVNDEKKADMRVNSAKRSREIVRFGLRGWENLSSVSGDAKLIEIDEVDIPGVGKRKAVKDSSLDAIKPFIKELAAEIERDNTITEADRKN